MTETAHSKRGTPSSSWFALACGASPDDPHSTCITRVAHARTSTATTVLSPPLPSFVHDRSTLPRRRIPCSHPPSFGFVDGHYVSWLDRMGGDGRWYGRGTRPWVLEVGIRAQTHTHTSTWWRATSGRRSECRRIDVCESRKHVVERCTVDAQSIHVVVEVGGWNEHVPTQVERCRGRSQSDGDGQPRTTRTGPGKDPLGRFVRA